MYEVVLKSWYQEMPNEIEEEIMYECDNIKDALSFLKEHSDSYVEFYPLIEISIRLKN